MAFQPKTNSYNNKRLMEPISAIAPSPAVTLKPSPWHSPIPYLFGGLAAIMGLTCFALLVLACSYWQLSGYLDENNHNNNNGDVESGNINGDGVSPVEDDNNRVELCDVHEKCLVIMAGENRPTFLATASSSRTTSFGSSSWRSNLTALTISSSSSSEVEMMEEMRR